MNTKVVVGSIVTMAALVVGIVVLVVLLIVGGGGTEETPEGGGKIVGSIKPVFVNDEFSSCCPSLTVTGTGSDDPVDQMIMGSYTPFDEVPSLEYPDIPGPVKKFPVYVHTFDEVREIGDPRRSFLYFYFNEDSRIDEEDCPEGCWMIGMHDPSKSNFWFGRKYFYLDGANKDLCPTKLTQGSAKFVNNKGTVENDFNVECSGETSSSIKSASCCQSLTITGTVSDDDVDKMIMGSYAPFDEVPSIEYPNISGPVKEFPVYVHVFDEVREIGDPRRSFLYFYFNEDTRIDEKECPQGCWMIGMHDPNKGNYWFGRKYFYLTGDNKDSCPSKLTQGATGNFVNNKGTTESNFKVECKN